MKKLFLHILNNLIPISIGIVYLFFGILKFFPGASPAEGLAVNTISHLTFDFIPGVISIKLLALLETSIGLFLISNIYKRITIIIALFHLSMTFLPFIFFPKLLFNGVPYMPTLHGQYVVKNLIIIGALISIYPFKHSRVQKEVT